MLIENHFCLHRHSVKQNRDSFWAFGVSGSKIEIHFWLSGCPESEIEIHFRLPECPESQIVIHFSLH